MADLIDRGKSPDLPSKKALLLFVLPSFSFFGKSAWLFLMLVGLFCSGQAQLTPFYQDFKVGYNNEQNEIVVPAQYDAGSEMTDGRAVVVKNMRYGYIDATGKVAIPLDFEDAGSFRAGVARVKQGGKYGYINPDGKVLIPFSFEQAYDFCDGLARIKVGDVFRFINTQGEFAFPQSFQVAGDFGDGLAPIYGENGQWGYINQSGNIHIPCTLLRASAFQDGRAVVINSQEGLEIDINGNKIRKLDEKVKDIIEAEGKAE